MATKLTVAHILASPHANSLSKIHEVRSRAQIQSLRFALENQLSAAETLLRQGRLQSAPELVRSSMLMTAHYFELVISEIRIQWPKMLEPANASDLYRSLLEQSSMFDTTTVRLKVEQNQLLSVASKIRSGLTAREGA